MRQRKLIIGAALAAGLFLPRSRASADSISSFAPVLEKGTSAIDYQAGSQFQASFYDSGIDAVTGKGTVTFDFENLGSIQSTIANIYFQDGLYITTPIKITDATSGVSWGLGSKPGAPPGATGFNTDLELDTSANNPKPSDGINNFITGHGVADELKLTFDYMPGMNFSGIQAGVSSGHLEVAFHVINYADGGSVTFVGAGDTTPAIEGQSLPLPSAAWGALPLLGLVGLLRKPDGQRFA